MCKSKFDNWSDVKDCNDCEHYWNKLCDGVPEGSERRCTAFKATRSVDIPAEINALRQTLKWFNAALILSGIAQVLFGIAFVVLGCLL